MEEKRILPNKTLFAAFCYVLNLPLYNKYIFVAFLY